MFKNKQRIYIYFFVALAVFAFAILLISTVKVTEVYPDEVVDAGNIKERPYTILILGKDKVSGLTDVMMLASFDTENNRICAMQIPRDTYAEYSEKHRKLNTAVKVLGGEKELCKFLSNSLGVHIDGYVSLELEGFRRAVDVIGGVEIELDKTLYYNDPEQDLYIYLPKGTHLLDGEKAEMLVRYRSSYLRGDLDRLDVQKRFVRAFFFKFKSSVSISSVYGIAVSLLPYIDTNVPITTFVSLGIKALKVDDDSLGLITLPGEDVNSAAGGSYYVMSAEPTWNIFEEYFVTEGDSIDPHRFFEHPTNENFKKIYARREDIQPSFAEN